jgi:hypothetical protein
MATLVLHPIEAHSTANVQIGEHLPVQLNGSRQLVTSLAQNADKVVPVHVHDGEAAGGGSLTLDR